MTDQSSGLRFDIYERIMLSNELDGIQQLDEIELVPQIQLTTQDEQAILKGHLLLTGKYSGGDDLRSNRNLEHSIPVEITLPIERIIDLENIGVEIENFDVDVLSARQLSVTGVLSLRGVELNASESSRWNDEEEEIVFVHQTEAAQTEAPQSAINQAEEVRMEAGFEDEVNIEAKEDKLKIAFNSQPIEETVTDPQLADENSLLHNQRMEAEPKESPHDEDRSSAEEVNQSEEVRNLEKDTNANSETEWKNLFLSRDDDEQQFSKMRMCIVQKQETIDTIAERYGLNPREIVLYNRLDEQEVAEGQIIYIPIAVKNS